MSLTKNQFEVLTTLEKHGVLTQREIADLLNRSIGTINKSVNELRKLEFVSKDGITDKGLKALEPYRVRRAVFLAAGFGSRLVPITLNTPKPLIRVNGTRMIDTLLDAILAVGIEEIYLVRGYMGELFDQLLYKYPMIKFIENPAYNESNNISSVLCARYLLKNAYLLEADLVLYNKELITKYQFESNYLGIPVEKSDDWVFITSGGIITKLSVGGVNCHQMVGVSYWNDADGARLGEHVQEVYQQPGGKERYWDQVALEYHSKEYEIAVRECNFEDIVEIDTVRELEEIDPAYKY